MTRTLSHEFQVRVPLNTIRLAVHSIRHGGKCDEETSYVVSCMDEAVDTMSDTLNKVLSYHKVISSKIMRDFISHHFDSAT